MAFKKRKIINQQQNQIPIKEASDSVDLGNNISEVKTKTTQAKMVESYRNEAKEILNILEKKGINIYDENRTPGMYLKRDGIKNGNKINFFRKVNNKSDEELQKEEFIKKLFK